MLNRRQWLGAAGALGTLGLSACATPIPGRAQVVVVGGGYGGATAARYLRLLSEGQVEVVLIEPNPRFISCPISNLVLSGDRRLDELGRGYEGLQALGVRVVRDHVAAIDAAGHRVRLGSGAEIGYTRLVLSPGIDFMFDAVEGLGAAHAAGQALHAWKAGPETLALRRQLEDLPDGGVFAIAIPEAPYRCPPGPYERASVVASYFKRHKPRSKVLVLDANPDVTSKGALFKKVWAEDFAGQLEYRPGHRLAAVSGAQRTLHFEAQPDLRADVLNVLPPMRAGRLAVDSGLASSGDGRWVGVDYQGFEAKAAPDIHVIGDAIQLAPGMPKSGHMANSHGKVAAAAVIARLRGWDLDPAPVLTNTCYSFVDAQRVIHVASVHQYAAAEKTYKTVPGSGGLSAAPNAQEGLYAWNWARTIWSDSLGA